MKDGGRVLRFKHRGRPIDQVDDGYLKWIVNEFPESNPWWKAGTLALTRRGKPREPASVGDLLSELKQCTKKRDLLKGRGLHINALKAGIQLNIYVEAALINLYAKCGSMEDARPLFDSIREPDVVCWNVLIMGYADNGQGSVALDIFTRMSRCAPNSVTYVAALKACTLLATEGSEAGKRVCLERGRQIHSEIGRHMDHHVQNTLINLYAKCGSIEDARSVFDSIRNPDVVSWTALILGYAENGQGSVALEIFTRMKEEGRCVPNSVTYVAALKACTLLAAHGSEAGKRECLHWGRQIHSDIGCHMGYHAQSTLINLYAKCGSMEDARSLFDMLRDPDVVCWNVLVMGYADNGEGSVAVDMFMRMKKEDKCAPDSVTYLAALKACTLLAADGSDAGKRESLERGRQIHSEIGCHMSDHAQSTLINLYAKCGSMEDARSLFDSIREPKLVCWNVLILGYAENGQVSVALDMFARMKKEGNCAPESVTYVAALKACTLLAADGSVAGKRECLEKCRQIHCEIDCHMDHHVQNTLINLYAKCGSMKNATSLFDSVEHPDVVSWTALIGGYVDNGQVSAGLDMFMRMKESKCAPNSVTYVAALKACTLLGSEARKTECLQRGRQIHSEIGRHMNDHVQSTLIKMYAKCGSMEDARPLFDSICEPNLVCWNVLILGYADNGQGSVSLDMFTRMKKESKCAPDSVTYVAALKACSLIGDLDSGRGIHSEIREFDSHVVTSLVDFYAKCARMEKAHEVFDLYPQARTVPTWTALLAGYAFIGDTGSVFSIFEAMEDQGFQPDAVTFVCLLSGCSHAGLVEKAWEFLEAMPTRYGITPDLMHYNCMIDLLGRANKLEEAVSLSEKMPFDPDSVTFGSLLGASRIHGGGQAEYAAARVDPTLAAPYVLAPEHIYNKRESKRDSRNQTHCKESCCSLGFMI